MITGTGIALGLSVYALLGLLCSLIFQSSMWIASQMLDNNVISFSENENIITKFIGILPFGDLNVGMTINAIAYSILVVALFVSVIKMLVSNITQTENIENPRDVVVRVIEAFILKILIFGRSYDIDISISTEQKWYEEGLISVIGKWFGTILSTISNLNGQLKDLSYKFSMPFELGPVTYIAMLILLAVLFSNVMGAAITHIERVLSFALFITIGPIALALFALKETKHVAMEWITSIFTQFFAILYSMFLWQMFINQIKNNFVSRYIKFGTDKIDIENTPGVLFSLAVAIVILNLIKNSEKFFASIGLRTLPNISSARSLAGGVGALMGSFMAGKALTRGVKTASVAGKGISSKMKSKLANVSAKRSNMTMPTGRINPTRNPFNGSQKDTIFSSSKGVTRSSLFDSKTGSLSLQDNKNIVGFATGSANVGIHSGAFAISKLNKTQGSAISEVLNAVGNNVFLNDLAKESNSSITNLSAKALNTAYTGYSDGYLSGGIRFVDHNEYKPMVAQMDIGDGNVTTGILAFTERIDSNGVTHDNGHVFIPTNNPNQNIPINLPLSGNGLENSDLRFDGTSYPIDLRGDMAYHVSSPERLMDFDSLETENLENHVVREEIFGRENMNFDKINPE